MSRYSAEQLNKLTITKLKEVVSKLVLDIPGYRKYKKADEAKLRGLILREMAKDRRVLAGQAVSPAKARKKTRTPKRKSPKKKSPVRQSLKNLGITALKTLAKQLGIPGYSKYRSANINQLITLIEQKQGAKAISPVRSPVRSPARMSPPRMSTLNKRETELKKLGITKLKAIAKDVGIVGYSKYKSADINVLINKILAQERGGASVPKRRADDVYNLVYQKEDDLGEVQKSLDRLERKVQKASPEEKKKANEFLGTVQSALENPVADVQQKVEDISDAVNNIQNQSFAPQALDFADKVVDVVIEEPERKIRAPERQIEKALEPLLREPPAQPDENLLDSVIDALREVRDLSPQEKMARATNLLAKMKPFQEKIVQCFVDIVPARA